ncbi:hybrid sensor histidine kinase/response regulator [Cytophagaceae bacterium ABcell3]|nr:hybrid sensor histidine kinase/response regulator [Cytophagaceae bacterium ABcell3]
MEEERIKILYVDDERGNLNMFKAAFRFDFDILLAESAFAALDILKDEEVHVIVADQKMPGMTGVELFDHIKELYKEPIRILLTAYADVNDAINAINKGNVFRYIKKPWDEQEIRMSINNAYEVFAAKRDLKIKNQELQKANEELNRFVYSASHDLKAPLLSIKGLLNVARLEGKNKNADQLFGLISNSVNQLETFIGSIISYYKNIRIESKPSLIDFEKIIDETLLSYQCYYYSSDIQYEVDVEKNECFLSDEFRIRVIINNLLSNAIKYQRAAEAVKKVRVSVSFDQQNHACLVIEDNGMGINNEYIKDIFNMFYRATRENSGSGIGLYIVKEAVLRVNGKIDVSSVENTGTRFTVHVPSADAFLY